MSDYKAKIRELLKQQNDILLGFDEDADEDKYYQQGVHDGIVAVMEVLEISPDDDNSFA